MSSQVRTLTRVFLARFFDNEITGGSGDLKTTFFWLAAFLAAPGVFMPVMMMYRWGLVATLRGPEVLRVVAFADETLFLGLAMIASAIVSALVWTSLLPDRRDSLVLGTLPVQPGTIVRAKLVALGVYVATVAAITSGPASLVFGATLATGSSVGFALRGVAACFIATVTACLFVLVLIAAIQGVLLAVVGPRLFGRLSPLLQSALVGVIVAGLLALPTIAGSAVSTFNGGLTLTAHWDARTPARMIVDSWGPIRLWIFRTPPLWFLGVHEWVLGTHDPMLIGLARTAAIAIGSTITIALIAYPLAYRRLMIAAVEQPGGHSSVHAETRRRGGKRAPLTSARLAHIVARTISRRPEVQAVSHFVLATVGRVERHRFVMAIAFGAAAAWGMPSWLALAQGRPTTPEIGLLALPIVTMLFLLVGLRIAMALPSELAAAWMFDVTPASRLDVHVALERTLRGTLVVPITAAFAALYWNLWGGQVALLQSCIAIATGELLVQMALWRFDGLPCAQPWNPEGANVRKWWPAYLLLFGFFARAVPSIGRSLLAFPIGCAIFIAYLGSLAALVRIYSLRHHAADGDDAAGILTSALRADQPRDAAPGADDHDLSRGRSGRAAYANFGGVDGPVAPNWRERAVSAVNEVLALRWGFGRDVVFALRRLRRAPLFTLFSVITLALGIGATTAVYSVIYSLAWRDVGIPDTERVVVVARFDDGGHGPARLSWPDFQDLRVQQRVFDGLSAWTSFPGSLTTNGSTTLIAGEGVSGGGFEVLGLSMALGRSIMPSDDRADAPPVVVLSDTTWRTRFGADPRVVGTQVKIGGRAFQVVGVAPATFLGVDVHNFLRPSVWVPLSFAPDMLFRAVGYRIDPSSRRDTWLKGIGRLRSTSSVGEARVEVSSIGQRLDVTAPLSTTASTSTAGWGQRRWDAGPASMVLAVAQSSLGWLYVAIPSLVLLVACTNLANLVLSRGVTRQHEWAVRRALGGSRARLIREQLIEAGMVVILGGAGGLLIAHALLVSIAAMVQETFGYLPQYQIAAHLDPAVVGTAAAAATLALIVAGLAPALQLTRVSSRHALETAALPRWRGRGKLIACQVAVSVGLLLLTALFVRELLSRARDHARPALDRVALVDVPFGVQQWDEPHARRVIDGILASVSHTMGVEAVAVSSLSGPQMNAQTDVEVTSPDRPFLDHPDGAHVPSLISGSPDIFRTLGIAMRSGRMFDGRDVDGATSVAVINERLSQTIFGSVDSTGRQILIRNQRSIGATKAAIESLTVIGVTADPEADPHTTVESRLYVPFAQHYEPDVAILVRAASDNVTSMVGVLRTAVSRADPELAISVAGRASIVSRFGADIGLGLVARIAASLAFLALGLAMAGLYGVLTHVVANRTRELGVRMALGANTGDVHRLIFKDGLRPVVEGLIIGVAGSAVLRMGLQSVSTTPISAVDLAAFVIAIVPLVVAAFVACYLPARRAARIDPNVALRQQ